MKSLMPQEIAVWYLLPSLRKELSRELSAMGASQKQSAKLLGITEAAVSQYKKKKRANELSFTAKEKALIRAYAKKILKDPAKSLAHVYALSVKLMGGSTICKLHKKQDSHLPDNCSICSD